VRTFDDLEPFYVKNSKNKGPACSRNIGLSMAKHDMVAFTDDDCVVSGDWLIRMYEYLRDAPKSIAGVGGRTIAYRDNLIGRYCEYHKILDPWFHNGRCLYLVTANAIFWKEQVLEVGGFDKEVLRAGGEDVGLCFKLLSKGYELLYNQDAIMYHDFDPRLIKFWKMFKNYGAGCKVQHDKHYRNLTSMMPGYAGAVIQEDEP